MTTEMNYKDFLNTKRISIKNVGYKIDESAIHPMLFSFQKDFVALKLGRKAIDIELKESYFKVAINNLKSIQDTLF